jgi:PEP-CTERM/exosortase A-associated glycosyltransferase
MIAMRILHVLDHSLPLHSGYAFRTAAILREQRALGWETFHLTSPRHRAAAAGAWTPRDASETAEGLSFFRTPFAAGWRSHLPGVGPYFDEMRATAARLAELVERVRPDVLHAHSPVLTAIPALRVGRRAGIPVVYEVRASWEDAAVDHGTTHARSIRYAATRAVETSVLRRAAHVTTICQGLAREIASRGIPPHRITVIPNAVDTGTFTFDAPPDQGLVRALGLQDAVVLGFIGSFYGYEGLELLVDAFARLAARRANLRLLFVGGGPREEALEMRVVEHGLGDRVRFVGRVAHDDVHRYYGIVDLLVYPRLRNRLTELVTPLKPLEAMAQGRLLVASDVGGQRELVRDGETGFLFPAGNVDALVDRIEHVVASLDGLAHVRADARRFVETERTWKASVARYRAVYDSMLRAGAAAVRQNAAAIR